MESSVRNQIKCGGIANQVCVESRWNHNEIAMETLKIAVESNQITEGKMK